MWFPTTAGVVVCSFAWKFRAHEVAALHSPEADDRAVDTANSSEQIMIL
jgi:hypothetical protein